MYPFSLEISAILARNSVSQNKVFNFFINTHTIRHCIAYVADPVNMFKHCS